MEQEINEYTTRFREAPWFPRYDDTGISICGAGGIGSWVALLLSRIGYYDMDLHDMDVVEAHNIGGQFFKTNDIGLLKVVAVKRLLSELSCGAINIYDFRLDHTFIPKPWVFSCFDNMEARRNIFKNWKDNYGNNSNCIFIDGRLTMEQLQIFCITGADSNRIALYEESYLFDDSEVLDAPCTMKQTSHSAAMIASHMVAFFTNFITNVHENQNYRAIPFKFEYFIPMDLTISDYAR